MFTAARLTAPEPTFAELFTPKLVTLLREGYGVRKFQADIMAGLTVTVVALPLSMAIAIASGTTPDRGLYTAIVVGVSPNVRHVLVPVGLKPPLVRYAPSVADARMAARHGADAEAET